MPDRLVLRAFGAGVRPAGVQSWASRHIPMLDGLRGIAILAVIVCHVNHAYGGPFADGHLGAPLAMVFGWGWVGVDLFFVLSGFLITGILHDTKGSDGFFRNFYARRLLRIMPLYYGFLFLTVIVFPRLPWAFCRDLWISRADSISLGLYVYNFRHALGGPFLPAHSHFWSLSVEEHFYLVWFLVVAVFARQSLMKLCLAVGVVSIALRAIVALFVNDADGAFCFTPCRLDGLLAGSWVALACRGKIEWAWCQRNAGRIVLGCGCVLLGIALGQRHFIPDPTPFGAVDERLVLTVGIAVLSVFFSGLIVLALEAAEGSVFRRILENKGLCSIGKYSYGMYVFHLLLRFWGVQLLWPLSDMPSYISKPIGVLWLTGTSFAVAWLSYHLYEKHFLQLKHFFEYRVATEPVVLVPAPLSGRANAQP